MPVKTLELHLPGFWNERFPSPRQIYNKRLWAQPALLSYTAEDSVATIADSVETEGTTRRCRHGHICIGAAICNSAVGKPDWATRRSLCLERRGGRVARHFPFDERDVEPQIPNPLLLLLGFKCHHLFNLWSLRGPIWSYWESNSFFFKKKKPKALMK